MRLNGRRGSNMRLPIGREGKSKQHRKGAEGVRNEGKLGKGIARVLRRVKTSQTGPSVGKGPKEPTTRRISLA